MAGLKLEKRWIEFDDFKKVRVAVTAAGIFVYFFVVLVFDWSYFNYFLISLQIAIQLFFLLAAQKESIVFNSSNITHKEFFSSKTVKPDFFILQVCKDSSSSLHTSNKMFRRILIYHKDKPKLTLYESDWENQFEKLLIYLRDNFEEYELKCDELEKGDGQTNLAVAIIFMIAVFNLIFGLGLLYENPKSETVQNLKALSGHIEYQPMVVKHPADGGSFYTMPFYLKEYPGFQFILNERGIKRINGRDFVKTNRVGDEISLMVKKSDYEVKIEKSQEWGYFTSHTELKNKMKIIGIYYDGKHILDAGTYKKHMQENNHDLALFFLMISVVLFGICVYYKVSDNRFF